MIFFTAVIVIIVEKNLDISRSRCSEQILPVPWIFVISRFHCNLNQFLITKNHSSIFHSNNETNITQGLLDILSQQNVMHIVIDDHKFSGTENKSRSQVISSPLATLFLISFIPNGKHLRRYDMNLG